MSTEINTLLALDEAKRQIRGLRSIKGWTAGAARNHMLRDALDRIEDSVGKARDLEAERLGNCVCGHEVCAHVASDAGTRAAGLYQAGDTDWHELIVNETS